MVTVLPWNYPSSTSLAVLLRFGRASMRLHPGFNVRDPEGVRLKPDTTDAITTGRIYVCGTCIAKQSPDVFRLGGGSSWTIAP